MLCERCKREVYRYEKCDYCGRNVCSSCQKASQTATKTLRLVICKDCWTNMRKRRAYKNKELLVAKEGARR